MKKALLLVPIVVFCLVIAAVLEYQEDRVPAPAYGWPVPKPPHAFTGLDSVSEYHFTYHWQHHAIIIGTMPVGCLLTVREVGPHKTVEFGDSSGPVPPGWQRIVIASN